MTGHAGDLSAPDTWALLAKDPAAQLVDVRTDAEWAYVGAPDLSALAKAPIKLAWQVFPAMAVDPDFVAKLTALVPDPSTPLAFLCRSGVRSLAAARAMAEAGYAQCYNIANGFEGTPDAARHRGTVNGWKVDGLPWIQG
jgi:rhodanese-related sulfurtransferase